MISLPGPMHDVTSDKSILGEGSSSGITGGGLNIGLPLDDDITSPPANAVHNVIVRNLMITNCPDDCCWATTTATARRTSAACA